MPRPSWHDTWVASGNRCGPTAHEIELPDGDRLLVLESIPSGWAAYRTRRRFWCTGWRGVPRRLTSSASASACCSLGIRVVRVNLRGAGDGFGLARGIYHAGRSDDLREVVAWLEQRAGGSPIGLVGFSLGANLVLKLAAEAADRPLARSRLRPGGQPPDRPGRLRPTDATPGESAL